MERMMLKIAKNKFLKTTFVFFMMFNLAFYQTYPAIAQAVESSTEEVAEAGADEQPDITEDEPEEEPAEEEISSNETDVTPNDTTTTTNDETESSGATDSPGIAPETGITQEDLTQTPADIDADGDADLDADAPVELWQTCGLENLMDEIGDDEKCGECKKLPTCPEIEICLKAKIDIQNEANVTNDVETTADTGQNISEDADRDHEEREERETREDRETDEANQGVEINTEIDTGNAVAVSEVVNETNTSIITDNGTEMVENIYGTYEGDINLLDSFNSLLENAQTLNEENQSVFSAMEISIENDADIENNVETTANTGQNGIDADINAEGSANINTDIITGNAVAATDVVNIVNTTIIGNNWLFVVINVFGDWVGDLIVPGEGLLSVPETQSPANMDVDIQNNANIQNNIETTANSGENEIDADIDADGKAYLDADVATGDAVANSLVTNQVNTTIVKNNWFFLAINNMGNWMGNIVGWNEEKNAYDTIFSFDFDETEGAEEGGLAGWFARIFIKNEADVQNNITTTANTGQNEIDADIDADGNADLGANINTGNAYAFSNVYNLVNTNLIGNNWMFATVNIFGSWQGDVEFAYPDLEITLDDGKSEVAPGEEINYSVRYKNAGKADCDSVNLNLTLPDGVSADETSWNMPGLKAGEEKTMSVKARINDDVAENEVLDAMADISTGTKEIVMANNSALDETTVRFFNYNSNSNNDSELNSEISIRRSSNAGSKVNPGTMIKNSIFIENKSDGVLYNVFVKDRVLDENGVEAVNYAWPIGEMEKGGKIMIQYDLLVNNPGQKLAVNYVAKATGEDSFGETVESRSVSSLLTVLGFILTAHASTDEKNISPGERAENNDSSGMVMGESTYQPPREIPLWALVLAALSSSLAYVIWKKKLYRWGTLQRMAQQASGFLSSFF
jgi:hypothetical protein